MFENANEVTTRSCTRVLGRPASVARCDARSSGGCKRRPQPFAQTATIHTDSTTAGCLLVVAAIRIAQHNASAQVNLRSSLRALSRPAPSRTATMNMTIERNVAYMSVRTFAWIAAFSSNLVWLWNKKNVASRQPKALPYAIAGTIGLFAVKDLWLLIAVSSRQIWAFYVHALGFALSWGSLLVRSCFAARYFVLQVAQHQGRHPQASACSRNHICSPFAMLVSTTEYAHSSSEMNAAAAFNICALVAHVRVCKRT